MIFPKPPPKGQHLVSNIISTINSICDILPKLQVIGDNKTTFVENTCHGTIVKAKRTNAGNSGSSGDEQSFPFLGDFFPNYNSATKTLEIGYADFSGIVPTSKSTVYVPTQSIYRTEVPYWSKDMSNVSGRHYVFFVANSDAENVWSPRRR